MQNYKGWYNRFRLSQNYQKLNKNPVAYFCMEYALPQNLPIYAGGLGVLAGDYVIEAEIQKFPMVAIGLLYARKSYIEKYDNVYVANGYIESGLKPVMNKLGERIIVSIPIKDRIVKIQAWLYDQGTIPVYLLDANMKENQPDDRNIMDLLYVSDPTTRLTQEIILGIGGTRLLEEIDIHPSIYHMNEGHSALLIFEVANRIMKDRKISFSEALTAAGKIVAFTNHTLVKGGHDSFSHGLITDLLSAYANEINAPIAEILKRGTENDGETEFSMTHLAISSAEKINAVSKLHSEVALDVWPNYPMTPITNGINIKRWDQLKTESQIRAKHKENKKKLIELIKKQTGITWGENDLIIGWARRVVGYKRPTALFEDIERIKKLLKDKNMPIRLVYSGYPHYSDKEGHIYLNQIRDLAKDELSGSLVYLENYSTDLSTLMVSGSDVWLNTPIVGLEACGTSGMKAALNGTLICSTNDGWLPEVNLQKIGFILDSDYISVSTRDVIANIITPTYYEDEKTNVTWTKKMQSARLEMMENFGTDRMLKDYIEKIYEPILESNR